MDYGFKIGVTLPLAQWSYTERIRNALEQRLLSYGCEMLFFCADNEEQKQAEQIEAMAAEGCGAIIVWPVSSGVVSALNTAKDSGILVALLGEKTEDMSCVDFYAGVDWRAIGEKQAEFIRDSLNLDSCETPHKVKIYGGIAGNANHIEILNGAMSVLEPYMGGTLEETEPVYTDRIDFEAGKELVDSYGWGEGVSAILGLIDVVPSGIIEGLCREGCDAGNIPIVTGAGDDKETLVNIRDGLQSMTVPFGYETLAEKAVDAAVMLLNGEEPENGTVTDAYGNEVSAFLSCEDVVTASSDFEVEDRKLKRIEINDQSGKEYFLKDGFPHPNLKVTAYYEYGSSADVSDYCTYTPSILSGSGTVNVDVTYKENGIAAHASVSVRVVSRILSGIEITRYPDKLLYVQGENFESKGIAVKAIYENGTSRTIAPKELCFSATSFQTAGENILVCVTYTKNNVTVSAQFSVTVAERAATGLRIKEPPKQTVYLENDYFCSDGIKLEAQFGNLAWREISPTDCVFSPHVLVAGDKVTVSYTAGGQTASAVIGSTEVVERALTGLKISRRPDKTEYVEGDFFVATGMIISAQYSGKIWREVNGYTYGTARLTPEDSFVTVSYVEGETVKSLVIPIIVYKTGLTGIEITSMPYKTVYIEDERFEQRGMEVYAVYSDGTRKKAENYSISPAGALSADGADGKTVVTVTYSGAQEKTATLEVTVLSKNFDNSKTEQTELKFDCGDGTASANLFSGRLLFCTEDASVCANGFGVSLNHVYNSCFNPQFALKYGENDGDFFDTYMGKGFKLDVQQYVTDSGDDKVYTDGAGMRHIFKPIGNGTEYFDIDGMGLVMTQEDDELVICDQAGNKMCFEGGRMTRTVSGVNTSVQKIFCYNASGQLVKAYDSRKPESSLVLEYSQSTGLLSTLKCMLGSSSKREINFIYDNCGFLTCIEKSAQDKTVFSYDEDGLLDGVASLPEKTALKFDYSSDRLTEVVKGYAPSASISAQGESEISVAASDVVRRTNLSYQRYAGAATVVRYRNGASDNDENDLRIVYFFNAMGFTTAVFETDDDSSTSLRTTEKIAGAKLPFYGSVQNRKINGQNVVKFVGNSITDIIEPEAAAEYRKSKCPHYSRFCVNFWLWLDKRVKSPKARVVVSSRNSATNKVIDEGVAVVDGSAAGAWQYVSVPVIISNDDIEKIELEILTDGTKTDIMLGDARLCYAPSSRYCLTDGTEWAGLDKVTRLKYRDDSVSEYKTLEINEDCYMSDKDLQATYLSRFKARSLSANGAEFVLSLCDCTEKRKVDSVILCTDEKEFPLVFGSDAYGNGTRAQYFHETVSPDGDVYTYVIPHFLTQSDELETTESCMMTVTEGNRFAKTNDKGKPVPEHKESFSKTYIDLKGRVLCETDEYGARTLYGYDAYGELCKKTLRHPDTDEQIVFETTATDVKTEQKTPFNVVTDTFDSPLGMLKSTAVNGRTEAAGNAVITQYTYDSALRRIASVENNAGGKNILNYDQNGRLKSVAPVGADWEGNYCFDFEYNNAGDLTKVFLKASGQTTGNLLVTNEADYAAGTVTARRYRSATRADEVKVTTDKYGRTSSLEEKSDWASNAKTTVFTRQTLEESAGLAEVTEIYDPFENRTYTYTYDDFNNCTGYISSSDKGDFKMKKTDEQTTEYICAEYTSRSETVYDKEKLIEPRLISTNDMAGEYFNVNSMPLEGDQGRVKYIYDKLGRLGEKQINVDAYEFLTIKNEYKYGTTSKEKITYSYDGLGLSENISKVFQNKYDARGRLTRENPVSEGQQAQYMYDKADRLIAEETAGGAYTTYGYNADGSLDWEETNGARTNYEYECGRLTRRGEKEFAYDNLGNCTNFGGTEMTWHRGNLLKSIGETSYLYDAQGTRYAKTKGNERTEYFRDGGKIIEEHRGNARIRYLYDAEGIMGFKVYQEYYYFLKDVQGNVRSVVRAHQNIAQAGFVVDEVARYEYDAWGNATSSNFNNAKIDGVDVAEFNPIRWKSQYYDTESGLYYINGRYYSPETKRYVDSGNPETALANAATIYGLNLQNSTLTNPVNELYNEYTIAAVTPIALDITEINVAAPTWLRWLVPSLQIVLGVILCFIPGAQGFGISLIAGGSIGLVSNILGSKIGGGLGTVLNGVNAIITGISLMGYGPIGWIMGGILLTVGAGTAALGANEVISGFTGNDTLRDWMGEELYDGLYLGLNIGSAVGTLAGRLYINYADVKIFDDTVPKKGKPFSRTTLITGKGVKQYRYYDRRGLALYDKDIIHGGKYKFPHYHGWLNGERLIGHWNFWELLIWLIGK